MNDNREPSLQFTLMLIEWKLALNKMKCEEREK